MKTDLIAIVNQIPSGKVVSYGQVAEQLCLQFDITTSGRLVGRMLSSMTQDERNKLPRQRVINKQ
jgi:alkylated DNA nucleotide flippase Atl1